MGLETSCGIPRGGDRRRAGASRGTGWQLIAAYVLSVLFPAIGLLRCKSARSAGLPGTSLPMESFHSVSSSMRRSVVTVICALGRGVEQVIGRVPGPTGF
jgi:hypothetical protein